MNINLRDRYIAETLTIKDISNMVEWLMKQPSQEYIIPVDSYYDKLIDDYFNERIKKLKTRKLYDNKSKR
ncbi:MAG: hypothetical protein M0R17_05325 [Candidatus Omnitrophica bacterium]|jgi:hypothetical protein|nr:hypothetical protein [Candidatus Omnitrophota bacterium]